LQQLLSRFQWRWKQLGSIHLWCPTCRQLYSIWVIAYP